MAIDIKRFLSRFVEEARDHLRKLEEGLPNLGGETGNRETINALFRSAHTIKGSARMLKLIPISEAAHRIEDVLGALRDGSMTFSPELGRLLCQGVDAIATQVDQLAGGDEPEALDPVLGESLTQAATGMMAAPEPPETPVTEQESVSPSPQPIQVPETRLKTTETVRIQLAKLDELIKLMGEVVASHARLHQRLTDFRFIEREWNASVEPGPLLRKFAVDLNNDVFAQELLMEELHNKALMMRMLPLDVLFASTPRMMRELGRSLGKEIECVVTGREIGLDRYLIDRLADPVVHLLRNAADHGIENAEERERAGKPRPGLIKLNARQDGGWVVIEVADDGAGLPLAAIRQKAIRKGILGPEKNVTDDEIIDFIFLPGFSTSAIITDVSGRGVGMDVVKRCIVDELQGVITVETRLGKGTLFALRLPLSLAVMRVLLVAAGKRVFGFTAQYIVQLLAVPVERILMVTQREAIMIDNEFIPVVNLTDLLSLPDSSCGNQRLLLVLRVHSEKIALRIDHLLDERDMVIKPLPEHLRHLTMVAGMVLTGTNELVSILHVPTLLEMARNLRTEKVQDSIEKHTRRLRVLVVDDSLNTREIERDVLEAEGFEVTLAEDGQDGLRKARQNEFDAIITDVEMPNMDGFSLTKCLRNEERYRDIPIIILTSRAKESDKRRGMEVGANAYIVKGDFNQTSLADTLHDLLG